MLANEDDSNTAPTFPSGESAPNADDEGGRTSNDDSILSPLHVLVSPSPPRPSTEDDVLSHEDSCSRNSCIQPDFSESLDDITPLRAPSLTHVHSNTSSGRESGVMPEALSRTTDSGNVWSKITLEELFFREKLHSYYSEFEERGYVEIEDVFEDIGKIVADVLKKRCAEEPGVIAKTTRVLRDARRSWNDDFSRPDYYLPEGAPLTQKMVTKLARNPYSKEVRDFIANNVVPPGATEWNPVPIETLSVIDVLKLMRKCHLECGYSALGDDFFSRKTTPAIEIANVDLRNAISYPTGATSFYRASVTEDSNFSRFLHSGGSEVSVDVASPAALGSLKAAVQSTKGMIKKHRRVTATASFVCVYATVSLDDSMLTLRQKVVDGLRRALRNAPANLPQRYNAIMREADKHGIIVVKSCDIGVRTDGTCTSTLSLDIDAKSFSTELQTAVETAPSTAVNAHGGARMSSETSTYIEACKMAKNMSLRVNCPTTPPGMPARPSLTASLPADTSFDSIHSESLAIRNNFEVVSKYAGDFKNYDRVTIREATTIFDLLPQDTEEDRKLRGEIFNLLEWHDSWSIVGSEKVWKNVQPLNVDGYSVWSANGFCNVTCKQFNSYGQAKEYFDSDEISNRTRHMYRYCVDSTSGYMQLVRMDGVYAPWRKWEKILCPIPLFYDRLFARKTIWQTAQKACKEQKEKMQHAPGTPTARERLSEIVYLVKE